MALAGSGALTQSSTGTATLAGTPANTYAGTATSSPTVSRRARFNVASNHPFSGDIFLDYGCPPARSCRKRPAPHPQYPFALTGNP